VHEAERTTAFHGSSMRAGKPLTASSEAMKVTASGRGAVGGQPLDGENDDAHDGEEYSRVRRLAR
jgi:hypothetical protein